MSFCFSDLKVEVSQFSFFLFVDNIRNQYQEQKAEDEFNSEMKELTKDLHHLLSTKQVRGVYNPNENYLPVSFFSLLPFLL